jgi:hypothetical protein
VEEVPVLHPFREAVDALYNTGRELFSSTGNRVGMTLARLLEPYPQQDLSTILKRYELESHPYEYTSRETLSSMIEDELIEPMGALEVIQRLDAPTRVLLKWVCDQGGTVSMSDVRTFTSYNNATLYNTLRTLEDYVVAFDALTEKGRVLFVPHDIYPILKIAIEQPEIKIPETGLHELPTPPEGTRNAETLVLYDLAVIIGAVYQQTLEPTQAGAVPKRLAARIQPLLHGYPRKKYRDTDDEYMEMLFAIARELGLLGLSTSSIQDVKRHYEPGPRLQGWSRLSAAEQCTLLLEQWTGSFKWLDLYGPNFRQTNPFNWNPMPSRSTLLDYLRKCKPGRWYSVESLLQTIWDENPLAMRQQQYSYGHKQDKPTGNAARLKWMSSEGEVYTGLLTSTLFEMGVVSLGYRQADVSDLRTAFEPAAFMLSDIGGAALLPGKFSAAPQVEGSALVVQPNFELLLLQPDMPTLYALLPFSQANQVELVSRLTLTRASLLRGLLQYPKTERRDEEDPVQPPEALDGSYPTRRIPKMSSGNALGIDIESIISILRERGQKAVPQNVEYTLRDWARQYKGTRLSQVILLETSSEALADEICASSKLQEFGLRRLGPCAIAAGGNVNHLRRALDKEGIIVSVGDEVTAHEEAASVTFGRLR